jgi:serine/tyrosine/threonine adenylyltransferase
VTADPVAGTVSWAQKKDRGIVKNENINASSNISSAGSHGSRPLSSLIFQSDFVTSLPVDSARTQESRKVSNICSSYTMPTKVSAPQLLGWSSSLAAQLGIESPTMDGLGQETQKIAKILSGNELIEGMQPYSARYGGHQFGHWAGQLGDGRAITLGEFRDLSASSWELQIKGAGPTPYSRRADGRAVLRSSVREFLCSEAMHHLGVPTTRALSLVGTGDIVVRDMFYDGNPAGEPGAITSRVAPSFLRFGNFQILADQNEFELLRKLADFNISRHFPEFGPPSKAVYTTWFEEICRRTAHMICEWQRVGFVHGVMNTDNMSMLGLTIDYGPYGWLEGYDPGWTPNTTDAQGRRYCYGNQPQIAHWNLQRLGEALMPLMDEGEGKAQGILERGLCVYSETFITRYRQTLADKLGLTGLSGPADYQLAQDFLELLETVETDMTSMFRRLADVDPATFRADLSWSDVEPVHSAFYAPLDLTPSHKHAWLDWFKRYGHRSRLDAIPANDRRLKMNRVNPNFVLRNYLAQEAIDGLTGGSNIRFNQILRALETPYEDSLDHPDLLAKRPEWARHKAGCSALSCSS